MAIEQIQKIEIVSSNINNAEKIDRIKNSLTNIKDIENIKKEELKDVKNREDLRKSMEKYIEDAIPGTWFENGIKFITIPITTKVLELYDDFINKKMGDISDFIEQKFGDIENIFSDKLNIQDFKIRHFVNTVYSVGYSFDKLNGKYYILDPKTNKKINLTNSNGTNALDAINTDKNLIDSLDEVLVERSFTGQGLNIPEMVAILKTIGINPENSNSLEKISPKKLAQAYLNYYAEKLSYTPIPRLNNHRDITKFLIDPKIKGKIPNEKITYIKLVQKNVIGTGVNDSTEHDTEIFKNIMSDFYTLIKGTEGELSIAKKAASNIGGMLKDGLPGLMKYMDGPEGLILTAGLVYSLFFSNFKKEAWLSIIGFTGLNVLTKAYNKDHNKGLLQSFGNSLEGVYKIRLPKALIGIEQEQWLQDKNNSKINTLSIISKTNFSTIIQNSKINNKGNLIEIFDYSFLTKRDKEELDKLWPAGNWKDKVNQILTQFIEKTATNTGTSNKTLKEQKDALYNKYKNSKYDNPSLSYVIADVLIWNITNTTTQTTNHSSPSSAPSIAPSISEIPQNIQTELNKITDTTTKNLFIESINKVIKGTYAKTELIADIDGIIDAPFTPNNQKIILKNLKQEINNTI